MTVFSLENEAFVALLKYGSIILIKFILMSPITSMYRFYYMAFTSREDGKILAGKDEDKIKRLTIRNPEVERVRKAHRNDIENIVPFFVTAALYLTIGPEVGTATLLFKIFAAARVAHTAVYLAKIPQPARVTTFLIGFLVNMYMAAQIVTAVW